MKSMDERKAEAEASIVETKNEVDWLENLINVFPAFSEEQILGFLRDRRNVRSVHLRNQESRVSTPATR